jgi:hypothetical protein
MNTEQKDNFRFRVVKYWASEEIGKRRSWVDPERYRNLQNELKDKDLADARCLLKMIFKEVDAHNAKIKTKITLLDKMDYKRNWLSSTCFSGLSIPLRKIDDLITNNPGKEVYEIVKLLNVWVL